MKAAMRNTEIVRFAMRLAGKTRIWTNKYDNCRTVKCYGGIGTLVRVEAFLMSEMGLNEDYKIKLVPCQGWVKGSSVKSIIVRLPLTY